MSDKTKKKVKQGFIAGSLTSSAGVFISKLIGMSQLSQNMQIKMTIKLWFLLESFQQQS